MMDKNSIAYAINSVSAALYTLMDVHYKDMTEEQRQDVYNITDLWRKFTIGNPITYETTVVRLITRKPPITDEGDEQ